MSNARLSWALTGAILAAGVCGAGLAAEKPADKKAPPPATRPAPGKPDLPKGWKLLYSQSFDAADALKDFEFSDPKQWRWTRRGGDGCMEAVKKGRYRPKLRSPFVIALLRGRAFGDFILEADLLQTGRQYGHRDMCLFFGFSGVAKYYYAHLGARHDRTSHNVLIVNGKPRVSIKPKATQGVDWGKDAWHRVRLVRKMDEGTIEVYFDDMTRPVLSAKDKTFLKGRVGVGSFDDCGLVDNLRIWGPKVDASPTPPVFAPASEGRNSAKKH
jgi:hypothetical protein